MDAITYKSYTIEPASNGSPWEGYDYYPTSEGRNDDADYDNDSYHYLGNVGFASSLEGAKDAIDEKIMEKTPKHVVIYGDRRVKEFDWLHEAYQFANMFGADLLPNGQPILNP